MIFERIKQLDEQLQHKRQLIAQIRAEAGKINEERNRLLGIVRESGITEDDLKDVDFELDEDGNLIQTPK